IAHLGAHPHPRRTAPGARPPPRGRQSRRGDHVWRRQPRAGYCGPPGVPGGCVVGGHVPGRRAAGLAAQYLGDGDRTRPPLPLRALAPGRAPVPGRLRPVHAGGAAAGALGRRNALTGSPAASGTARPERQCPHACRTQDARRLPGLRHPISRVAPSPHHAPLVWLAPATPAGHDRGRTQRGEGNMQITPSPVTAAAAGVVSALVMTALWPRLGDDSLYWVLAFLLVIALPVHVFVVGFGRARPASSADPAMIRRVAVWLVAGLATVGIGLLFGR